MFTVQSQLHHGRFGSRSGSLATFDLAHLSAWLLNEGERSRKRGDPSSECCPPELRSPHQSQSAFLPSLPDLPSCSSVDAIQIGELDARSEKWAPSAHLGRSTAPLRSTSVIASCPFSLPPARAASVIRAPRNSRAVAEPHTADLDC